MDWLTQRFELSRGGGHNERPMEGLRGFAVFLVFLVHFVTFVKPWISENSNFLVFTKSLHTIGNTGVDLFLFSAAILFSVHWFLVASNFCVSCRGVLSGFIPPS